jgi:hypothetical protein
MRCGTGKGQVAGCGVAPTGTYQRKFNPEMYSKHDWLCGCDVKNALFCFPCLLFGDDVAWTRTGVTDLGHLPEKKLKSVKALRNT